MRGGKALAGTILDERTTSGNHGKTRGGKHYGVAVISCPFNFTEKEQGGLGSRASGTSKKRETKKDHCGWGLAHSTEKPV